tara:strand:+ start:474 stop:689 length:216 start_codon:yes stop_codon:yes gene_type:complete
MKQFEILRGKYNMGDYLLGITPLESFEAMTYKKAIKKIGKKYNDQNIILTYTNKHQNKVLHPLKKGRFTTK